MGGVEGGPRGKATGKGGKGEPGLGEGSSEPRGGACRRKGAREEAG